MANILYISLTGMTEPLGRSQVLEYLIDLNHQNNIYLISFERESDLGNIDEIKALIEKYNIQWHYLIYSNKYGVLSTLSQIFKSTYLGSKLIKAKSIEIIHARSMIPATIGMILKNIYNVKLLFDIRGFAIDEKVDGGRLKRGTFIFSLLKKLDNHLYRTSDHIITLTHKAKEILADTLNVEDEKITVIPTCANKEIFKPMDKIEKDRFKISLGYLTEDIVIIHTGTVSGWYDFEKEVNLVNKLMKLDKNIYFLILNKQEHQFIQEIVTKCKLPKERVKITSCAFDQIYKYLNIADISLFFIKPSYSKQASAPTKFAENVACYLPSITNSGVGDMAYYMQQYDVGYIVDLEKLDEDLDIVVSEINDYIKHHTLDKKAYDALFSEHFDKKMAVRKYQYVYDLLMENIK